MDLDLSQFDKSAFFVTRIVMLILILISLLPLFLIVPLLVSVSSGLSVGSEGAGVIVGGIIILYVLFILPFTLFGSLILVLLQFKKKIGAYIGLIYCILQLLLALLLIFSELIPNFFMSPGGYAIVLSIFSIIFHLIGAGLMFVSLNYLKRTSIILSIGKKAR